MSGSSSIATPLAPAPGRRGPGLLLLSLFALVCEEDELTISELALQNFRCYEHVVLELPRGLNIFVGPNASGKTSLLEAVLVLATTKSPRTLHDYELVRWDNVWGRVSGQFRSGEGQAVRIAVTLKGSGEPVDGAAAAPSYLTGAKHLEVDGQTCDAAAQVVGRAPAVFFSPDGLQLVKGAPSRRRRFLNTAIAQITPRHLDDLRRYRRALAQRNALLKQVARGEADGATLAPWTSQLVEAGARISADRERFVGQLSTVAADLDGTLTGGRECLEMRYQGVVAGVSDEQEREAVLREQLDKQWSREVQLGATQVGPHRDEVAVSVNGRPLRQFGSQGQQRTAALAIKLAEAQVIGQRRGELPVLLLDDCLSELDPKRASWLLELLAGFDQVFVTSAVATEALQQSNWTAWYNLAEGAIDQERRGAAGNESQTKREDQRCQ